MFVQLGQYYYQQACFCIKGRNLSKAVDYLKSAAALQPQDADIYNLWGLCVYKIGEFEYAKTIWQQSIDIKIEDNEAIQYLKELETSTCKQYENNYKEAVEKAQNRQYKKAIQKLLLLQKEYSENICCMNLLGLCYYATGKRNKAVQMWGRVLAIDESNAQACSYIQAVSTEPQQSLFSFKSIFRHMKR